jgi:Tol biopolymer transport system component
MDRVGTSGVDRRTVGIVLLIVAVSIVVLVAARSGLLATDAGEAGQVAFASGGDIYAGDPMSGEASVIVSGPEDDSHPRWSPDGSRLVFVRAVDGTHSDVLVADGQGRDPRSVTPEPLADVSAAEISPDGTSIVIAARRGDVPELALVGVDGEYFRWLDTGGPADRPTFVPPTGDILAYVTGSGESSGEGLAAMALGSGTISSLVDPSASGRIIGYPSVARDGSRIAFGLWIPATNRFARVYTVASDGSDDPTLVPAPTNICCEGSPAWSNDGTRLAIVRWYGSSRVIAIVPWESGGTGSEIALGSVDHGRLGWSPDDRLVRAALVSDREGSQRLPARTFDVETGEEIDTPWTTDSDPAWRSFAP